jgi:hypothetical protein
MNVSLASPSCNAAGSVDAVHIGKQVRCKHCGAHFAIPDPEASQPDVYALEEPSPRSARGTSNSPAEDAVFVPAQTDATSAATQIKARANYCHSPLTAFEERQAMRLNPGENPVAPQLSSCQTTPCCRPG